MSRRRDSNLRPADYKSAALPAELHRLLVSVTEEVAEAAITRPSPDFKELSEAFQSYAPQKGLQMYNIFVTQQI